MRLFQQLLAKFVERGRHNFYRLLFHQVSHSGVKGLLVQAVKNEVDSALKVSRPVQFWLSQLLFYRLITEREISF